MATVWPVSFNLSESTVCSNMPISDRMIACWKSDVREATSAPECRRVRGWSVATFRPGRWRTRKAFFREIGRKAEFQVVDALQPLPFQQGDFDVIICSEMLEHVTNPGAVIANIADICTVKTRVILTVPLEAPKLVLKRWLERLGVLRFLFPGIERGQSEWHLQAFSRTMLHRLTEPLFISERVSIVWGCHIVGRFHKKGAGGL